MHVTLINACFHLSMACRLRTCVSSNEDKVCAATKRVLTSVPSDIPASATSIYLYRNSIGNFSHDDFTSFYQLRTLKLGSNPFTQLPNLLPVGGTLKELCMHFCKMIKIDSNIFNELRVLQAVDFQIVYYVPFRTSAARETA